MDQIPLNTSSQSDIDEIESLFNISVQPATLEVPPSVPPARKPSSPPATIPVSVPLLPPSSVSSSSQAFSTPQPPPAHTSGLWPHFTCSCVWICVAFLPGLCLSSSGQYFSFVQFLSTIDRICGFTRLLCLLMVLEQREVVVSSMMHVLWICCSLYPPSWALGSTFCNVALAFCLLNIFM